MTSAVKFMKRQEVVSQKKMDRPLKSDALTIKNSPMEDVGKGAYRNQECPCGSGKKLKKCDCGIMTRLREKKDLYLQQLKNQREALKQAVDEVKNEQLTEQPV